MRQVKAQEIHAAYQAATWYVRLEDGLSEVERYLYLRWLSTSPANGNAMRYIERLTASLRTKRSRRRRH